MGNFRSNGEEIYRIMMFVNSLVARKSFEK